MPYVECFVAAVPAENEEAYKKKCIMMNQVFKDHGAERAIDCWGAEVPDGEVTSFPKAVKAGEGEIVCIGFVEWSSKEARDKAMPKAMADERMEMSDLPFDGKRLIFGGFESFSEM